MVDTPQVIISHLSPDDLGPTVLAQARAADHAVVVLPDRVVDGRPVYASSSAMIVKRLRAAGVDAAFLDQPDQRTFELKKSGALSTLITIALGVASSAAWDGIKALLTTDTRSRLEVTYLDLEKPNVEQVQAWKVEGDSESVLRAIDKLKDSRTARIEPPSSTERSNEAQSDPLLSRVFTPAGPDDDLVETHRRRQVAERRASAESLLSTAQDLIKQSSKSVEPAERDARAALVFFARSLDWAEDTDEEETAHRLLDEAGAWVRRTFGCHLERSGLEYRQNCPVALSHNRIGFSVGGYARRMCSVCGADLSECEHVPGTAYMVPGGSEDLGWCRVCMAESCSEHKPDQLYRVSVIGRITEMSVEEVSLVFKPAQPEARIATMSVPASDLREALGDEFVPGVEVSCDRCLLPCSGLIKHHIP